jgi:hypothetical protein
VFEGRAKRRVFQSKTEEVTGNWRKSRNKTKFLSSLNMFVVMKLEMCDWKVIQNVRNIVRHFKSEYREGWNQGLCGRVIIKTLIHKLSLRAWIGVIEFE